MAACVRGVTMDATIVTHAHTCLASPRRTASLEACRIQARAVVASDSRRAWTTAVNASPRLAGPPRSRRVVSKRALWLLASLSMHEWLPLIRLSFYTKDRWPGRAAAVVHVQTCWNMFGIHGLRGGFSLVSVLDKCGEFGRRTIIDK